MAWVRADVEHRHDGQGDGWQSQLTIAMKIAEGRVEFPSRCVRRLGRWRQTAQSQRSGRETRQSGFTRETLA